MDICIGMKKGDEKKKKKGPERKIYPDIRMLPFLDFSVVGNVRERGLNIFTFLN